MLKGIWDDIKDPAGRQPLVMASIPPTEELELLQLIADAQTTNYLAAAGLTVLVIEHISTLPEEIEFVWKSRLSLWSVLYVRTRYYTLVAIAIDVSFMFREIPSSNVCRYFILAEMITSTVESVSVDSILVLRVWILYNKSRWLIYFLVPLMTAEIIALLTIGTLSILPAKEYVHIGPILKGCYPATVPRLFAFYAVPLLAIATIVFLLTLYKCSEHLLRTRFAARMPIVTQFLRDGVFLFLTILVYTAVELGIWFRGRPTLVEAPIIPATALHAVLGARILLNIKNLGTGSNVDSVSTSIHLSTMSRRHRSAAARARVPWYLQTGEQSDGEGVNEEDIH
ncbi:hypothetical protein K438DRAFT_1942307 [Mycena galopus ATCC 62051]|nr:hypothetical protein K438DRAFT_1942307 [Mycena galopus ATCC 62051]